MFDKKIEDFFKKHNLYDEEMFAYIYQYSYQVDYYDDAQNCAIGGPPKTDKYTDRIEGPRVCYPYVIDEITRLIAVHELAHAIYWYQRIGKKPNRIMSELFPMIVEKLYIEENRTSILEAFEKRLDSIITPNSPECYRFALANRDNLLGIDLSDVKAFDKKSKKLLRKWKRENK